MLSDMLTSSSPRQIILVVAVVTLIYLICSESGVFNRCSAFLPQSEEVETYDVITEDFGKIQV